MIFMWHIMILWSAYCDMWSAQSSKFSIAVCASSASWLQLRVKKIADWMKCNIIYLKISWNSRAYKIKNTWLWNEKHVTLKFYSVHHVLNKAHDLILMLICTEHFLNLKLCQCWSNWFFYTCAWTFAHS